LFKIRKKSKIDPAYCTVHALNCILLPEGGGKGSSGGGSGLSEDKKAREQLLALNQVLARQVMEKSRGMVAGILLFLYIAPVFPLPLPKSSSSMTLFGAGVARSRITEMKSFHNLYLRLPVSN
jgi:hypothetical protein